MALEAFRVHYGRLPYVREFYDGSHIANDIPDTDPPIQATLTSPVSFIAALPGDPFRQREYHYYYVTDVNNCWMLGSVGPNRKVEFFLGAKNSFKNERWFAFGPAEPDPNLPRPCDSKFFNPTSRGGAPGMIDLLYEPTNGIASKGDIIKTGP